ncbi:hypothetical protein J7443_18020 [Tropicibacter sp. R15_0]|uniref:hypothetical protein n=1 Tax=Tropicibacter sp. R15_0 TaxID=2821101 RepID=UPI001ADA054C|nr:hypothetical protein [Tropicibacter sp. R15_0]MBO9467145.1 hypothetical protein [Tropicibacter sp. R15_0]
MTPFSFMVCGAVVSALFATNVQADPFDRLQASRWVWGREHTASCENGQFYTVSDDRQAIRVETGSEMMVRGTAMDFATYTVLGHGENYIDMSLDQEIWRNPAGELVWWRLHFLSNGSFVWYRSDWFGGHTAPVFPCRLSS